MKKMYEDALEIYRANYYLISIALVIEALEQFKEGEIEEKIEYLAKLNVEDSIEFFKEDMAKNYYNYFMKQSVFESIDNYDFISEYFDEAFKEAIEVYKQKQD